MTARKIIRYTGFASSLLSARLRRQNRPLSVILCVTNRCNLRCWYCYGEHPFRGECREFTTVELLELIDRLHRLGAWMIQIQGGEPMLREDLPQILLSAQRQGLLVDMVTNGTLIPKRPEILRRLDTICISLDGPRETNDRNRGDGSFHKAVAGMDVALKAGLPVRISTVLTADTTREDIDWLVAFARERGLLLNFSPSFSFVPHYRADGFAPHIVPDQALRGLLRHIASWRRRGAPIQFSAASYEMAADWPFPLSQGQATRKEMAGSSPEYPPCRHGDYVVFIDSDGSVYPCCNFWGEPEFNVHTDGLEAALTGLSRHGCDACHIPAYIDRNRFLDLQACAWWNYLRRIIRPRLRDRSGPARETPDR